MTASPLMSTRPDDDTPRIDRRSLLLAGLAAPWAGLAHAATLAPALPVVRFASVEEAATAITDGPDRAYIDRLNLREMRARMPQLGADLDAAAARAALRRFYASQVLAFDDEERAALRAIAVALQSRLSRQAPWLARTPWSFIKLSDQAEGGMPHTRGAWIVLPASFAAAIARHAREGTPASGLPRGTNVVLHEQVHVLQRADPARFAPLYTDVFGFVRMNPAPRSRWLDEHVVTNPDGPDLDWAWPQGRQDAPPRHAFLPATVLPEPGTPSLQSMTPVALPLEAHDDHWHFVDPDTSKGMVPLEQVPGYAQHFPWTGENFHPNEIAADLVMNWLIDSPSLAKPGPTTTPAINWAKSNLG
jgi:hypothetical protein